MPVFRHEVSIERPVEAVFAAVADVNTHPNWQAGLIQAEAAHGILRLGEKGAEVRRMFGRSIKFPYEITRFEPPKVWGFRALAGPIRPSAVLFFKSTKSRTIITSHLTIPAPAGWLLGPWMLLQQKRNYRTLKALLEAGKL
jgi:uncharacterized protein YndB with AHSA1/START domain